MNTDMGIIKEERNSFEPKNMTLEDFECLFKRYEIEGGSTFQFLSVILDNKTLSALPENLKRHFVKV